MPTDKQRRQIHKNMFLPRERRIAWSGVGLGVVILGDRTGELSGAAQSKPFYL